MSIITANIFDRVAALLNDSNLQIFTYAAQLPYLNVAIDELAEEMEQNNVEATTTKSSTLTITTGTTVISATSTPAYPSDLINIQTIWEKLSGSDTESYAQLTKVEFLPPYLQPVDSLIFWTWQEQEIRFVGATSDRDVMLQYIARTLNQVTQVDGSDIITLINAQSFLSYRTAALCANYIGENATRSTELNTFAQAALNRFLNIDAKGRQVISTRRRPFRARFKSWSLW